LVGAEVNDIRCVYGTEFAEKAHELLNKKVKVSGQVEYSQSGKPRLLEVEDVEILPDDPKGMPLPFKE